MLAPTSNFKSNEINRSLTSHCAQLARLHLKDLFAQDPMRFHHFSLAAAGLFLDYSKQRILPETLRLLCQLVSWVDLAAKRDAMFSGVAINSTEQRAVLHTALRDASKRAVFVNGEGIGIGENVKPLIHKTLQLLEQLVSDIRCGVWCGFSGEPIKAVVNIGIGGSDLGPAMATAALTPYTSRELECYFVSNIDPAHISGVLRRLNPATTLFIVASKTFTTQETLCNAVIAKQWLLSSVDAAICDVKFADLIMRRHFIAVTAKVDRASAFGIVSENIYPFWDWVGGRYSLWSAIGLSVAIAVGMENFRALLAGAYAMDVHFQTMPYHQNMPVIMALIDIWNINFLKTTTRAVIPYDQSLSLLPAYLQQLEMESNGKHVRLDGEVVDYATASVIWGATGTNGQHAFHQLLMQGTQTVPVDFIAVAQGHDEIVDHRLLLFANCLAQSRALMCGRSKEEVIVELCSQGMSVVEANKLAPHKVIDGNVPSNTIMLDKLTPFTLGALLALYEHKVFVQGVLWNINSFDQWGVELGKNLATNLAEQLRDINHCGIAEVDASTYGLMARFRSFKDSHKDS